MMIGERLLRALGVACLASVVIAPGGRLDAATPALVQLKSEGRTYEGKVAALGDEHCWLVERDGRMHRLAVARIEAHRQVSARFSSFTTVEMRDRLRRELGAGFEVVAKEHCLVAAPRGDADRHAELLEEVARAFRAHFSVRGFPLQSPEFPLVAVVHPSRAEFIRNCETDGVTYAAGLVGYYHPASNRVSLYDPGAVEMSRADGRSTGRIGIRFPADVASENEEAISRSPFRWAARNGSPGALPLVESSSALRDTLIHEATHQVAFNTGLHSRVRENPRWVVEGLATVFEAPGIREAGGRQLPVAHRINRERFVRFGNYARSRRPAKSLAKFVADDELLTTATLDFYAQSWALTFFLVETRSAAYAKYLKAMAERSPTDTYTDAQRIEDFRSAFGDVERLEIEFLRHLDRIATTP